MSWTCLPLFANCVRSSWSGRTGTGRSPASTPCQRKAISGSASASRVTCARSASVDGRRRPVSRSRISAALPSTERYPWAPSSGRSQDGSRAASVYPRGAAARAASMSPAAGGPGRRPPGRPTPRDGRGSPPSRRRRPSPRGSGGSRRAVGRGRRAKAGGVTASRSGGRGQATRVPASGGLRAKRRGGLEPSRPTGRARGRPAPPRGDRARPRSRRCASGCVRRGRA